MKSVRFTIFGLSNSYYKAGKLKLFGKICFISYNKTLITPIIHENKNRRNEKEWENEKETEIVGCRIGRSIGAGSLCLEVPCAEKNGYTSGGGSVCACPTL